MTVPREGQQNRAGGLLGPVSVLSSLLPGGPWWSLAQPSHSQQPHPDVLRLEGLPLGHLGQSSEVHRARWKLQLGVLFPWATAVTQGLELKELISGCGRNELGPHPQ